MFRHGTGVVLAGLAAVTVAASAVALCDQLPVAARPARVEIALYPTRDTYLGQGRSSAQDASMELQAGWVYETRGAEFRTYLEFPLDAAQHPVDSLIGAELRLYPEEVPETSEVFSSLVVRTMSEPFAPGRIAPSWFASGDPTVQIDGVFPDKTVKRFNVREHVDAILREPDEHFGFEVAGVEMRGNSRWDFYSVEGGVPERAGYDARPRLVLMFRDDAFATPTPTGTAPPTEAPTAAASATTAPTAVPTRTASPTATRPATVAPGADLFLPRVLRGS
jgi:hypothetical protein